MTSSSLRPTPLCSLRGCVWQRGSVFFCVHVHAGVWVCAGQRFQQREREREIQAEVGVCLRCFFHAFMEINSENHFSDTSMGFALLGIDTITMVVGNVYENVLHFLGAFLHSFIRMWYLIHVNFMCDSAMLKSLARQNAFIKTGMK